MAIDPEVTVRAFLAEMEGREWDAARIERLHRRIAARGATPPRGGGPPRRSSGRDSG